MFVSTGMNFINTSLLYKIFYRRFEEEIVFYYINGKNIKLLSDDAQESLNSLFESIKQNISGYLLLEEQDILLNKSKIEKVYINNNDNKRLDILLDNSYIEKIYYQTEEDCKQNYDIIVKSLIEKTIENEEYVTKDYLNEQLSDFANQMGEYFTKYVDNQIQNIMEENIDTKIDEALDGKLSEIRANIEFLTEQVNALNDEVFGQPV